MVINQNEKNNNVEDTAFPVSLSTTQKLVYKSNKFVQETEETHKISSLSLRLLVDDLVLSRIYKKDGVWYVQFFLQKQGHEFKKKKNK